MAHAEVVLFEHANYQGASLKVEDDLSSMPSSWNDRVSSVRTTTPITLFQHSNYGGDVLIVNQDTPSLANVRGRNFNDRTSSVRVNTQVIRLNIILGARQAVPAHPFADINEDIEAVNRLYGPYGIRVNPARLSIGGGLLYEPHTSLTFSAERNRLRVDDYLNVTYFKGTHYTNISWRWLAKSLKIVGTDDHSGTLKCRLYTDKEYTGDRLDVTSELTSIPSSHRGKLLSLGTDADTAVTLFSEEDFRGRARTFRHDVADLTEHHDFYDWWGDKEVHVGGDANNWKNFNITMRPGASHWELAWAIGAAMKVSSPSGSRVSFAQAEQAMRHLHAHTVLRSFIAS